MTPARFSPAGIRAILLAAFLGLVVWGVALTIGYSLAFGATQRCQTRSCLVRAVRWQKHDRARLHRELDARVRGDVELAYRLAIGLFHVDLRRLGYCESRNDPTSYTGPYVGITQQGPNFQARNRDVYRLLPVTNALANVLVAARWIARHGAGEWTCRLDGSVR